MIAHSQNGNMVTKTTLIDEAGLYSVDKEYKKLNDKTSSSFGQCGVTLINESRLYSTKRLMSV